MFTTSPQLQVLHQPFLTVCNMHMTTSICLWRACLMITTLRLPSAFLWLTTESQRRKIIIFYILDCKFWLLLLNWYWLLSETSNSLLRDLWSISPLCAVSLHITQNHSYFHNHIRSYNRRYLISCRLAANDNPIKAVFELLQVLKCNMFVIVLFYAVQFLTLTNTNLKYKIRVPLLSMSLSMLVFLSPSLSACLYLYFII